MIQQSLNFDGGTFSQQRDGSRLSRQLLAVKRVLSDERWHRLPELALEAQASTASVSARIRDLRKARFGGHQVDRRYVENGIWEYRIHLMGMGT